MLTRQIIVGMLLSDQIQGRDIKMDLIEIIVAILIVAALTLFSGTVKEVCKKYFEGGEKRHDDQ